MVRGIAQKLTKKKEFQEKELLFRVRAATSASSYSTDNPDPEGIAEISRGAARPERYPRARPQ